MTPEEKAALKKQLAQEAKQEKEKKQADLATLKELQNNFLEENIDLLVNRQGEMEDLVNTLFANFGHIISLKAEVYGTERLEQDSHTVTNADGTASITIGQNVNITFDGSESAGVQKIMDYLTAISGNEDNEDMKKMSETVKLLLKPSLKTKMLNPAKIIQLNAMRNTYNSPEFDEGMDIIVNAQIRQKGSSYVSGYKFVQIGDVPSKKIEFRFTV
ncbi:DUF3164 family protein [Flavobacterium covae]|uniref:DUF3164 family protein n=1 Tax=Flavobacterium covae TaxID=2906076 RepID=UPI001FB78B74|nr:DUF3164 family protein [Flavobacterium covae]MCJ1809881.1 DUF3164 family protein [Flavobacterium covae]